MDSLSIDTTNASFVQFPWAAGQTAIALPPLGYVCDPYSLVDDNILTFIRYSTVFFNSTPVSADGAPFLFPAATTLQAFSDGPGEKTTNTGKQTKGGLALALTQADTNLERQGAMVPQSSSWFLCQAMGFSFGEACVFNDDGSRVITPHLTGYGERTVRALADVCTVRMSYEDTKTDNDLGIVRQWPAYSQMTNADDIATISTSMYGNGNLFTFPFFAGSRCACNLINFDIENEEGLSITSDTSVSPTLMGDVLTIPLTLELYGRVFCLDALRAVFAAQNLPVPSRFLDGNGR